jgi:hypothetical protein
VLLSLELRDESGNQGNITMEQKSFSSLAYENKQKKTRREKFLEEMDNGRYGRFSPLGEPVRRHPGELGPHNVGVARAIGG